MAMKMKVSFSLRLLKSSTYYAYRLLQSTSPLSEHSCFLLLISVDEGYEGAGHGRWKKAKIKKRLKDFR